MSNSILKDLWALINEADELIDKLRTASPQLQNAGKNMAVTVANLKNILRTGDSVPVGAKEHRRRGESRV
jgi:seryl-tRNA synthetase